MSVDTAVPVYVWQSHAMLVDVGKHEQTVKHYGAHTGVTCAVHGTLTMVGSSPMCGAPP